MLIQLCKYFCISLGTFFIGLGIVEGFSFKLLYLCAILSMIGSIVFILLDKLNL